MSEADDSQPGREIWIEKYRPERLDDIHGQSDIVERLQSYIDEGDLPHLLMAGPAGVGKCVTGDTLVLTSRGLERINSIVGDTDGFDDPEEDLAIVTLDGTEFRPESPSKLFGKQAEETVEIHTRDGNEIVATPEHQLLVATETGLEWTAAAELTDGDRIARPLSLPAVGPSETSAPSTDAVATVGEDQLGEAADRVDIATPTEMTTELARFGGLLAASGRVCDSVVTFETDSDPIRRQFTQLATELFGDAGEPVQSGSDTRRVEIHAPEVAEFLTSAFDVLSTATSEDQFGAAILGANLASRAAFIGAIYEAVGSTTDSAALEMVTGKDDLTTLVSYLLATMGIPSRRESVSTEDTDRPDDSVIRIHGRQAIEQFCERVGVDIDADIAPDHPDGRERVTPGGADTVPAQTTAMTLCQRLNLDHTEFELDAAEQSPVLRDTHSEAIGHVLDAATGRLEAAQAVLTDLDRLQTDDGNATDAAPAVGGQSHGLSTEPATTAGSTAVEMAAEAVPEAVTEPPAGRTLDRLASSIGVSPAQMAAGDALSRREAEHLFEEPTAVDVSTAAAAVSQLRTVASDMLSSETIRQMEALDRIAGTELYLDAVESVEEVSQNRRVYDLTVPGSRNYVAGRVPTVMHNTTSAVSIAREIYGDDWQTNFLELNASDQRGIDVVRDRIKSFARESYSPNHDHTVIFLDEADSLCVPPGTDVITGDPSDPDIKPIEAVSAAGEAVPSVDFKTNQIQPDVGSRVESGVADFLTLELDDGRSVVASPTHPFFIIDETGRLVERELTQLAPGDRIADFSSKIGVSRCERCEAWKVGRVCSSGCGSTGAGSLSTDTARLTADESVRSDGGLQAVDTAAVSRIDYSHRGPAYNISMEGTPNFMLANGILTHNTDDAQSALRRTMEQFSDSTRFILSCNYSSKIIDPIQSRCAVFRYSPLSDEALAGQLEEIATDEGIELTDEGLDALVYAANGDMRRGINSLQAAATTDEVVDAEAVYAITSTARPEEIEEMVQDALTGDFSKSRSTLETLLLDTGMAGGDVIDQLHRSVWEFGLSDRETVRLMERIGEADYRISEGANEQVQLEALLASLALDSD